ncbi:gustatory receptor 68a-like [Copidosoma floridanum]|uniref:gustatory receptor 68a-like n=1 Tax=Copidosoma floridanum TaxID=29053 RepID=UPI000C6F80DA|nr:gustatory receptor 68a-like [Copidosoma floridanum]
MLVYAANTFLTLTMYTYYFIKPVIIGSTTLPATILVYCFVQIISSTVSLVVLTKIANSTAVESKKTGEIIAEGMVNLHNPQVIDQLNKFLNYLNHKTLHFGVSNFFTLDGSLLMSIIGSITTYLVILLQFQENSDQKRKNEEIVHNAVLLRMNRKINEWI